MKPSEEEVKEAVRTLIKWAGDNPNREGLEETPKRVLESYKEHFCGYDIDPKEILSKTFSETENYDEIIMLNNIRFESFCEHHLAPIIGRAAVAYKPKNLVVGISKLARLVDVFAKRLQLQERMTSQIANAIEDHLQPEGVAVMIWANHQCLTTRGAHKPGVVMQTSYMTGCFKTDFNIRQEFFNLLNNNINSEIK